MVQRSGQTPTEDRLSYYIRAAGYRKPTLLQQKVVPLALQGKDLAVEAGVGEGRTGALLIPLLVHIRADQEAAGALVLTGSSAEVKKIAHQYRRFSARVHPRPTLAELGVEEHAGKELKTLQKKAQIIVGTTGRIIDHIRRGNISLDAVERVVLVFPESAGEAGFDKDVQFIYSKLPARVQTVAFAERLSVLGGVLQVLKRPQQIGREDWCKPVEEDEETGAAIEEKNDVQTSDTIEAVRAVVGKVREADDTEKLDEFRRLFRRATPLHMRGYVAAYLLRDYLERRTTGPAATKRGLRTLFVSIGKNRKVYPKDIAELFSQTLKVDRSTFGSVRVLDNYSFVDLPEDLAERAMKALDNVEFRGRRISVSIARKKEEKRER